MAEISIIIPVYNKAKCIEKCVDSVLKQSFTDFECILVDDGSTDDSLEICNELKKKDSRVAVLHKENGGVSSARNAGLDIATGNFVVFIDPDDYVSPDYLMNLYEPGFDLVCTRLGWKTVDSPDVIPIVPEADCVVDVDYESVSRLLDDAWIESACARCFKRSVIVKNNIRFLDGLAWGEDTLFAVSFASKSGTVRLKNNCDYYYVSYGEDTSLSTGYSTRFYDYCKMFSGELRRQLKDDFGVTALNDAYIKRILFMYEKTMFSCATIPKNLSFKEKCRDIDRVINDSEYKQIKNRSGQISAYAPYIRAALNTGNAGFIVFTASVFKPLSKLFRKKH